MIKKLKVDNFEFEYILRKSNRSKNITIRIGSSKVSVSAPTRLSQIYIDDFLKAKIDWIYKHLSENPNIVSTENKLKMYKANKVLALDFVKSRLEYFNSFYNFRIGVIKIKNQTTLWGSCSKNGNLNFNYKIAFLPQELSDYIIVHELCHLKEFNHSKSFWELVALAIPDFKKCIRLLRTYEFGIH